jgi:hypothetical protein
MERFWPKLGEENLFLGKMKIVLIRGAGDVGTATGIVLRSLDTESFILSSLSPLSSVGLWPLRKRFIGEVGRSREFVHDFLTPPRKP